MQIKRFSGHTLPEVLSRIDRELGSNALIVQTRQTRHGGFFGVMGRQGVEVTVAVDYNFRPREDMDQRAPARSASRAETPARTSVPRKSSPEASMMVARRELNEMRVKPRELARLTEETQSFPPEIERMHRLLVKNGVEDYLSRRLLKSFDEQLSLLGEDFSRAAPMLEKYMGGLIRTCNGLQLREGRKPLVAAFIGPTGVGKTTTIAKIASYFSINLHRRVAIVTADTFRIGATDQVKRYGEILGIPVRVIETPEDLQQVLLEFSGYDLVLMDTAGRSPQNREQIMHLKQLIEIGRPDEVYLVVSMTTKYIDVLSVVAKFGIVPVNRLILTKFDETRTYGLALNLSANFAMDIAYITTGQQVPDDIEVADSQRLAKLILSGGINGRPGIPAA